MNATQAIDRRNPDLVRQLADAIAKTATKPWKIMEICGGQTHAILHYGLDQLLPAEIELVHGPGCPVCVTSLEAIDAGIQIALLPQVIFTSFGDMLRVPGSSQDLFSARAQGADLRVVTSPMDSVRLAQENPDREVVFFSIGFETTAPVIAASILHAQRNAVHNFSILPANVLVPPAMRAILGSPQNQVNAFLAAGHVCAVMGYWEYEPIAERYHCPIVVTGFEPAHLLEGILMAVRQLETGESKVQNAYGRAVTRDGNLNAQSLIKQVFEPVDRNWRGIGTISQSGLGLKPQFEHFDALTRFSIAPQAINESTLCIAGQIMRGNAKPTDCPAFGRQCTPQSPLGAPMVSAEGACAAYYRYHKEAI
jgi:hydrogenase expression/formation protein HypD